MCWYAVNFQFHLYAPMDELRFSTWTRPTLLCSFVWNSDSHTMMAEHLFSTFCKWLYWAYQPSQMFCVRGTAHFFCRVFFFGYSFFVTCSDHSNDFSLSNHNRPWLDGDVWLFSVCFWVAMLFSSFSSSRFLVLLWMFLSFWQCSEGWLWPFSRRIKESLANLDSTASSLMQGGTIHLFENGWTFSMMCCDFSFSHSVY